MPTELQTHIDEIGHLGLAHAIQAIAELAPDLTTSVTPGGVYLVHHPAYEGTGKLNDLGKIYLDCARRCQTEHAAFQVRLRHIALEDVFTEIYRKPYEEFKIGYENGTIVPEEKFEGCGCCSGRPDAVILSGFHEGNALYFDEAEYRQIWGSQESRGSSSTWNNETNSTQVIAVMASKEQVEEAMARNPADGIASHL